MGKRIGSFCPFAIAPLRAIHKKIRRCSPRFFPCSFFLASEFNLMNMRNTKYIFSVLFFCCCWWWFSVGFAAQLERRTTKNGHGRYAENVKSTWRWMNRALALIDQVVFYTRLLWWTLALLTLAVNVVLACAGVCGCVRVSGCIVKWKAFVHFLIVRIQRWDITRYNNRFIYDPCWLWIANKKVKMLLPTMNSNWFLFIQRQMVFVV